MNLEYLNMSLLDPLMWDFRGKLSKRVQELRFLLKPEDNAFN